MVLYLILKIESRINLPFKKITAIINLMTGNAKNLEDMKINVKLKISALWVALLFLYAYGDIFGYFRPGFIEEVLEGKVFVFDINQVFLMAVSIYITIPSVMVFLSLVLRPHINRWVNIIIGLVYAATILLSTIGDGYVYYYFLSIVETILAVLIVWYAWNWPREGNNSDS
jgi:hypothetical protein